MQKYSNRPVGENNLLGENAGKTDEVEIKNNLKNESLFDKNWQA